MIEVLNSVRRRLAEEQAKTPKDRQKAKERENMIRALEWLIEQIRGRYAL